MTAANSTDPDGLDGVVEDEFAVPAPVVVAPRPAAPRKPPVDYFAWVPSWVPRLTPTTWAIALIAIVEAAVLSYFQGRNYLSFLPTQGDLGDYNQAFYTTVHGQGFFYYTTNIPGGSVGSIFAVHFAPFLIVLLPFYALAPGPTTLIVLKQLALCLGVLPVFGLAKVYFRKPLVPLMFATLYLLSPFTVATDWNSFDPESFFPVLLMVSLYFFARGRFWPFLAFWFLAMGTIEAASGLMLLFALGGLVGTFLPAWFSQMVSPYWTAAQQRRPLLIATIVSAAWLALAFLALQSVGRGGGFGNAYAARYTVLGATSLPNVLVRAATHPGAAGAALQFGGSQKAAFVVLLIAGTGVVSWLGGLRYLLPITGFLGLALLSNNAAFYLFGTEYDGLVAGFLFAGSIEGAARISMVLHDADALANHQRIGASLRTRAQRVIARVRALPGGPDPSSPMIIRLKAAIADLRKDQLGSAESRLTRIQREMNSDPAFRGTRSVGRARPSFSSAAPGAPRAGRLRRHGFLPDRQDRSTAFVFAVLVVIGLAASELTSPFGKAPVNADLEIQGGNAPPTAHEKVLEMVLKMIPQDAAVLTTSHLFPQLSNRPNAFVVPDHAYLPIPENYSNDINHWVSLADYIAVDYVVDPQNTLMLMNDSNRAGFGLWISDEGAVVYERHWVGPPALLVPWVLTLPLSTLRARCATVVNTSSGPALLHSAGCNKGTLLWNAPNAPFLPLGKYNATFLFELTAPKSGPQLNFTVNETLGSVHDFVDPRLSNLSGRAYHQATFHPNNANASSAIAFSNLGWLNSSTVLGKPHFFNVTLSFTESVVGYVNFGGFEISKVMTLWLFAINVTQLTAL